MSVGRLGERKWKDINRMSNSPNGKAMIAWKVIDAAVGLAALRITDVCRERL